MYRDFIGVFQGIYRGGTILEVLEDCFRNGALHGCCRAYSDVTGVLQVGRLLLGEVLRDVQEILQLSSSVLSWYFPGTLSFLSLLFPVLSKYILITFPLYSF